MSSGQCSSTSIQCPAAAAAEYLQQQQQQQQQLVTHLPVPTHCCCAALRHLTIDSHGAVATLPLNRSFLAVQLC